MTGVRLRPRGEPDPSAEHELPADLVVDATGRVSRAPDWLEALGYDRPQMTLIDSFFGYASRQYAAPTDHRNNWRAIFLMPRPPHEPRCGLLFPIESGRWICTLAGAARHYPPTDPDAFVDFAASLRDPVIHDQIRDAEPLTAIQGYRQMDNRRHHFERLPRWPDRFLVVGDAACAFNPIYGQGMSVAAQTAVALDGALYARRRLDGFARRFQRRVAACSASAWLVATGDDLRYPTTEGARPGLRVRMTQRYLDRVVRAAMYSPAANEAFVDVLSLLEPPTSLFRPRVMAAALRPRLQALQPLPMPAHA